MSVAGIVSAYLANSRRCEENNSYREIDPYIAKELINKFKKNATEKILEYVDKDYEKIKTDYKYGNKSFCFGRMFKETRKGDILYVSKVEFMKKKYIELMEEKISSDISAWNGPVAIKFRNELMENYIVINIEKY